MINEAETYKKKYFIGEFKFEIWKCQTYFLNIEEDIDNLSGDGGDDGEDGEGKQEYVKKEYIAKPYTSTSGVLEEVENSIIKNNRPRL